MRTELREPVVSLDAYGPENHTPCYDFKFGIVVMPLYNNNHSREPTRILLRYFSPCCFSLRCGGNIVHGRNPAPPGILTKHVNICWGKPIGRPWRGMKAPREAIA